MEAESGTVLFEQNADEALPPASVTKVMTLLLVMEAVDNGTLKLTDMIRTSTNASSMGGSQIYLKEGEELSAEYALYPTTSDALVALNKKPISDALVLLKGSRGIALEKLIEKL